mmetsp:Transcript_25339/g.69985  ORF Transcript_25339/g.69985 Transcript_25339/m.69985 type:complete len:234 (-) Transcript_25339:21-722(-)
MPIGIRRKCLFVRSSQGTKSGVLFVNHGISEIVPVNNQFRVGPEFIQHHDQKHWNGGGILHENGLRINTLTARGIRELDRLDKEYQSDKQENHEAHDSPKKVERQEDGTGSQKSNLGGGEAHHLQRGLLACALVVVVGRSKCLKGRNQLLSRVTDKGNAVTGLKQRQDVILHSRASSQIAQDHDHEMVLFLLCCATVSHDGDEDGCNGLSNDTMQCRSPVAPKEYRCMEVYVR